MGNVIQGLNQDGQNSGTFLGNYTNIGSTTTNFTGANVNFTGTNQNIVVGYTGSTGAITYWNSPSFMTGASFPDGTRVTFGSGNNAFLDANGKINSSFIPTNTTSSTVNTLTVNQTVSGTGSINLPQGSITGANIYGKNYYLETSMSGTGSINIGGTLNADKIFIKNAGGNIDLQNSGDYIRLNAGKNASKGIAIYNGLSINDGAGLTVGTWTPPGIGNISAAGTVSAPSFTGSNYYLETSMTGPGSINVTGGITGSTGFFQNLNANNPTGALNLFTNSTGTIEIGGSSASWMYINRPVHLNNGRKVRAGGFDSVASTSGLTLGGIVTTANIDIGNELTSGNINVGNTATSGTGTINLRQNVTAAKNLTVTGNIQGPNVKIQDNNVVFSPNGDKGLIYTGAGMNNWSGTNTPDFKPSDGMMLYGWMDGALGTKNGGDKASLYWDHNGNVNVRGALRANSSKVATSAPVGGLRVQGLNEWVIGENSSGSLCFYKGGSSITPFACINTNGNLVAGTG